jgi:diguanylate cyclase
MIDKPRVIRILIVEDSEDDAELLTMALRRAGYAVEAQRVETSAAMDEALDHGEWDVVVSDFNLPHFSALGALGALHERSLDLPFIIVSGAIGEEVAVICMKAGAHDYVMKDSLARLIPAIEREIREAGERAERRRAEQALIHLALHDALTGLPNRTLLQDRLEQAILANARDARRLAVMLIDLDRFKEINDAFGHLHGDRLLQQIGTRLQAVLKATDTVARLGGDEFAIVLPACGSPANAEVVAGRLSEALEQPFAIEGQTLRVAGSIGIVMCPDHGRDFETLMRRADTAMYTAKREGEGFCVYATGQDQNTASRLTLSEQLREGIDGDELVAHYQPKVSLVTGDLVGVEALARWQHPDRGLMPADSFIPLAEQTGLIKPLSAWMLNAVLKQSKRWREQGLILPIAVNLSMRNLHDPQLPDQVAELLKQWDLPPESLQVEITETVLMSNPPRAMEVVTRLSKMGLYLSIDDFGTGYSSLAYLKRLPVQEIKIDKSFVRDMARDENDAVIVRSTVDLGHNLGLKVVAEGVETRQAWDQLLALGCDSAQGFYMAQPMPAAGLERWLDERHPALPPRRKLAPAAVGA